MCSPGRCLLVLAVFVAICVLVACRFVPETPSDSASAESPSVSASASSATPDSQHTSDTSATPAPNPISTSRTSSSSNSSPDESSAPATAPDNSDSANQPKTQPTIYQYQTEERWVEGRHGRIYGLAYIPEGEGPWPLVVCSHGLGGTHLTDADYAQQLAAHGYAAYTFDFNGGSSQSKSEGSTLDMSAQTEADDLEDVMDASQNWEFVNHDKLFLFGESQGGLVSAIAASRRPQDIDALCLLVPAFVLIEFVPAAFAQVENVPESFSVFG
ncbi:MAG: alpha/beta fold hydrolase, partial [Atopobiaceae bacterium]|nr:alpha/beta fold hydrolase [Atopobiaceae bacterium]